MLNTGQHTGTSKVAGNSHRQQLAPILLFFVILVVAAGSYAAESVIQQQELLKKLEGESALLILDVRTAGEYQSGHVPRAINIPHYELQSRLNELLAMKDLEIVTYCERGPRAGVAEAILKNAGFTTVRHLDGDMSAWRQQGLPVERP